MLPMTLLEAEVHISLREFLRHQGQPLWDHHLTMARLVSRALRLDRSALIQTGSTFSRYGLSYLMPCLLSDRPILLVVPSNIQQKLIEEDIPYLQRWLNTNKAIATQKQSVNFTTFKGLLLLSPDVWLGDHLNNQGQLPDDILTLIDQADYLEEWTKDYLTLTISPDDWQQLQQQYSSSGNLIQEVKLF